MDVKAVVPILTPINRPIHPIVQKSWHEMIVHAAAHGIVATQLLQTGTPLHQVRNRMAVDALRERPSHLFTLDSDLLVPPDLLTRLWQHHLPVVSGLYYTRGRWKGTHDQTGQPGSTYFPVIAYREDRSERPDYTVQPARFRSSTLYTDLMVVDGAGLGCTLVEAGVFGKLEKPWYAFPLNADGTEALCGEDHWFFDRVQKAGFEVVVDTTIMGIMHHTDAWVGAPGRLYSTDEIVEG